VGSSSQDAGRRTSNAVAPLRRIDAKEDIPMHDTTQAQTQRSPARRRLMRTVAIGAVAAGTVVMSAGCFGTGDDVITSTPGATGAATASP
jgi:hypothetical protein